MGPSFRFNHGVNTLSPVFPQARMVRALDQNQTQPEKEMRMIKAQTPLAFWERDGTRPLSLSAANFSRTPLGRAVLHLECLCHHPAAARFYFRGLTRNLREWAHSVCGRPA